MIADGLPKPIRWMGRSHAALKELPKVVRGRIGYALSVAQDGGKMDYAKPLKGFGGAGVLEIVSDFDGNAYRGVYTVRFADVIYVLHVFEKKSKRGIETPKEDMRVIQLRLKQAQQDYQQWRAEKHKLPK